MTCQPQEEWLTTKKAKAKAPPPGQRERRQLAIINFGQSGVLETPDPSIVEVPTEPEPQAATSGSAELEPQAGQVEAAQAPQPPKAEPQYHSINFVVGKRSLRSQVARACLVCDAQIREKEPP